MKESITLLLVRHAHRDTSKGRELDNGLSEKGKLQRDKLEKYISSHFKSKKPSLFSSPSKRCVQTLEKIAKATKTEIKTDLNLTECTQEESITQFKSRIKEILQQLLKSNAPLIVVCSHGDWIPFATKILCGTEIGLSKGGLIEFEANNKTISLKNVFQKLE